MASPARKPPAGSEHPDEALDILRRLEPVLARVSTDLAEVKGDVKRLDDRLGKVEAHVKNVDDRLGKVETNVKNVDDRLGKVETNVNKLDDALHKVVADVARIEGRMSGIEGQLRQIPTHWQLAGLIFAIFSASFVLIHFASGH